MNTLSNIIAPSLIARVATLLDFQEAVMNTPIERFSKIEAFQKNPRILDEIEYGLAMRLATSAPLTSEQGVEVQRRAEKLNAERKSERMRLHALRMLDEAIARAAAPELVTA